MADTHAELLEEWKIPIWSSGYWGVRFAGITGAHMCDSLAEGAATGLMATWVYDFRPTPAHLGFEQPRDALARLGEDAGRPLYPGESSTSIRGRLRSKWAFWTGSPKAGILEELAAAGYGAPAIKVPNDYAGPPDSHTDYWSRFWLIFPESEHPITGPGTIWAEHVVGTTPLGPEGMPADYVTKLRSIVRRLKPARWVPWQYQFELPSGTIRIQARPMIDEDWEYFS